MILCDIFNKRI